MSLFELCQPDNVGLLENVAVQAVCHSFALRLYFRDSYEWRGNETLESLGDSINDNKTQKPFQ